MGEQDLDKNHDLLPCPEPVLDPGQNQDPAQNQVQDRGQDQNRGQNRRSWVVIVMMTLERRKREWSVRPLAAMVRPEAEVITKLETEVTKSGNELWPEVTLKMRM